MAKPSIIEARKAVALENLAAKVELILQQQAEIMALLKPNQKAGKDEKQEAKTPPK